MADVKELSVTDWGTIRVDIMECEVWKFSLTTDGLQFLHLVLSSSRFQSSRFRKRQTSFNNEEIKYGSL